MTLSFFLPDFTGRSTAVSAEVKEEQHKNQFLYLTLPADLVDGVMTEYM